MKAPALLLALVLACCVGSATASLQTIDVLVEGRFTSDTSTTNFTAPDTEFSVVFPFLIYYPKYFLTTADPNPKEPIQSAVTGLYQLGNRPAVPISVTGTYFYNIFAYGSAAYLDFSFTDHKSSEGATFSLGADILGPDSEHLTTFRETFAGFTVNPDLGGFTYSNQFAWSVGNDAIVRTVGNAAIVSFGEFTTTTPVVPEANGELIAILGACSVLAGVSMPARRRKPLPGVRDVMRESGL